MLKKRALSESQMGLKVFKAIMVKYTTKASIQKMGKT